MFFNEFHHFFNSNSMDFLTVLPLAKNNVPAVFIQNKEGKPYTFVTPKLPLRFKIDHYVSEEPMNYLRCYPIVRSDKKPIGHDVEAFYNNYNMVFEKGLEDTNKFDNIILKRLKHLEDDEVLGENAFANKVYQKTGENYTILRTRLNETVKIFKVVVNPTTGMKELMNSSIKELNENIEEYSVSAALYCNWNCVYYSEHHSGVVGKHIIIWTNAITYEVGGRKAISEEVTQQMLNKFM